jgi:Xaa-Pro aminopeptidase
MAVTRDQARGRTGIARLATVELPEFEAAAPVPELSPAIHRERLGRLRERAEAEGYDRLVIYADREHSANLAWLTGFDPRFEEAIAVIGPAADPAILVGNENWGTAGAAPLPMRRHLHQDLSLPSQPRDRSRPLREVLAEEGIGRGTRVGVVGWKPFEDSTRLEIPSYLADDLRSLTGSADSVENAVDLLIGAADGLRVVNEVEQLAAFEAAACKTSDGVRRVIRGLEPGRTERQAVRLLEWTARPCPAI